jgi:hypothetical protein
MMYWRPNDEVSGCAPVHRINLTMQDPLLLNICSSKTDEVVYQTRTRFCQHGPALATVDRQLSTACVLVLSDQ